MDFIKRVISSAQADRKRIVLPEANEARTLRAVEIIIKEKIADLILLGDEREIKQSAKEIGVSVEGATIVNHKTDRYRNWYANMMLEIRSGKGLTKKEAFRLLDDPLYFAPMMILNGDADGAIAGATSSSAEVLRPALQFAKPLPGTKAVSGVFLMFVNDPHFGYEGMLIFADCSVIPNPTERQLAEIAITTAHTAKSLIGMDPRVAMLSFSTKGSAAHPNVDKVVRATKIANRLAPDLKIDGEMQLDAAIMPEVAQMTAPGSDVAGRANILVFPNLEAANIGYNLVHRLGKAEAIGPILQGMSVPINDLSRGCSVGDIITMAAITANQAQELAKAKAEVKIEEHVF